MQQNNSSGIEFGYWGVKGLGGFNRLVAKHLGVQLNEYNPASADEWFGQRRNSSGLEFPNLPYLKHGSLALTEHSAINSYLCNYSGNSQFLGLGIINQSRVQMVLAVLDDVWQEFFKTVVHADYKNEMQKNLDANSKISQKLKSLSQLLGNNNFLIGDTFSIVDIKTAYFVDFIGWLSFSAGVASPFDTHKNLKDLQVRVYSLPTLSAYVQSAQWRNMLYLPPNYYPWIKAPEQIQDNNQNRGNPGHPQPKQQVTGAFQ